MRTFLKAVREREGAERAKMNRLFDKAAKKESGQKQQEMKRKIEEENAATAEAMRVKYAKEAPAEWNESEADKALRRFVKSLAK